MRLRLFLPALLAFMVCQSSLVVRADDAAVLKKIDRAIEISKRRFLTSGTHTPWQIMHGILALRADYEILENDKPVSAMKIVTSNPRFRGKPWFSKTKFGGAAHGFTSPYIFEGHPNQFFAIMSMSDLPRDFEFQTDDGPITVDDLIANAKMTVNDREEITWTLWSLSRYLDTDERWTNARGERWDLELLVRIQNKQEPTRAACGGTHGLFALAQARNARVRQGHELTGYWMQADNRVNRYIATAKQLQNPDGTFSSSYFKGRQHSKDFNKRIETTGHTFEFIAAALPQEKLREEWILRAIDALTDDLINNSDKAAKVGPLYHALSGLVIYKERITGTKIAKVGRPTVEENQVTQTEPEPVEPQMPIVTDEEREAVANADTIAKTAETAAKTAEKEASAIRKKIEELTAKLAEQTETARTLREEADSKAKLASDMRQKLEEKEQTARKEPRKLKPKQVSRIREVKE